MPSGRPQNYTTLTDVTQGDVLPYKEVTAFAESVEQNLAARGAHVAIVARAGRDPEDLPDGLRYTHVAYWVYSQITHADGRITNGYRVYNLYQLADDPTRSELIQDSPTDFFASARVLDAGIIIPKPALQKKLLRVIDSPTYATLHNARYTLLANPVSQTSQNCTEHTLDVLMASLYDTGDRRQLKANIAAYSKPQRIDVSGVKRLVAPAISGALSTSDHGAQVKTATFGSIGRFMERYDLAEDIYSLSARPARGR
jgi:hypothetical protein